MRWTNLCLVLAAFALVIIGPEAFAQKSAKDLNLQGIDLQSRGKLSEAAEQYRKAIQLNPQGAAYHNNLALVLKDLNDLVTAEQEARIALRLRPKRPDYHYNLGIILQRLNKHEQADRAFKEAQSMSPMDPEFHFRRAQTLTKLEKIEEAEQEIKTALLLKPDEAQYHQTFGDILMKSGNRSDEALLEFRKAIELTPGGKVSPELANKIDYLKQISKPQ